MALRLSTSGFCTRRAGRLPMFGDPDPTLQGVGRLGHDRLVAGSSSSSCATAPPVEQPEVDTVPAGDGAQLPLRLVERPVARDVAGVLARVAIAEHYLLQVIALL